ncbi:DUF2793 domain-containing protein [Tardiphaga sp. 42S5]|uniref:DUF2793 domain-containing protein n=1 Tax=Tardiphaga sp. 42S5 TaxID=1404799 RepID=UPI002A5A0E6C|nr:DUF2793 domain-containing protein [Tardiphaga sp. 42S5]WPO39026.1 DUF2793 domain-containing protein [Tardiphaga sp. 42S5]
MTDTPNLKLPFIESGQAQKHVTHNEALRILDAAIQISVLDVTRTVPPASPAEGARHIVAAGASGAWSGHTLAIATWQDGAWTFLVPKAGWCVWSIADDVMMVFDGDGWRDLRNLALDNVDHLGVHTDADSSNRFSVKSDAVLLSHDDVTPGSGDLRVTFNKSNSARDVGLTFQSNYSPRALMGLLGDDNLTVKVSADGVSYRTAMTVDRASGQASFEQSPKFLAYLNFDKYCAANTFTKVQFNNARHNDQSAFDAGNNQFVAPVAGIYALGFRVMFKANAAVPTMLTAAMYKNGVELLDDTRMQTSSAIISNRTMLSGHTLLKLAAGDAISVWAAMETNDGYIAAAQNSFHGYRVA